MEQGNAVDGVVGARTKGKTVLQVSLREVKVKPKSGGLIPAKKKLVKTMMFDYLVKSLASIINKKKQRICPIFDAGAAGSGLKSYIT